MNSQEYIIKEFQEKLFWRNNQWYVGNLELLKEIIVFCEKFSIALISLEVFQYNKKDQTIITVDIQNYTSISSSKNIEVGKDDREKYVKWTCNKVFEYGLCVPFYTGILVEIFSSFESEWYIYTDNSNKPNTSNFNLRKPNKVKPSWI